MALVAYLEGKTESSPATHKHPQCEFAIHVTIREFALGTFSYSGG